MRGSERCSLHAVNRARPKLTDEATDKLLSLLRAGSYVDVACDAAGVARRTFYKWWKQGDPAGSDPAFAELREFRARVEQAKADAESRLVAVVASAARENWQAAAWQLERRYPERWARPSQRDRDAERESAPAPASSDDPFAEIDQLAAKRRQRES